MQAGRGMDFSSAISPQQRCWDKSSVLQVPVGIVRGLLTGRKTAGLVEGSRKPD